MSDYIRRSCRRTNNFISLNQAQPPFFVGIDLGGTNIKVGVVDDLGRPLSWLTDPTESEKGPEDAARRMGKAVLEAIRKAGLEPAAVARVGLGSPGTMDIPAGKLVKPVNLKGWDDFPLRDRVSAHCGLPVTFRERRQRRRLRRVLGRLRPRFSQHGAVHAGHGHRLRHHHRRPVDRRREQPRGGVRPHHHRLLGKRPAVRLRTARPPGSLRQRHGRDQADATRRWRRAGPVRSASGSPQCQT